MGGEFSGTRLYLGNLPRDVTKREVEDFFKQHGNGNIVEVKLMNGFGFIQYDNEEDPKDIVPDGREFKGQRLTVQFARGNRHAPRENTFAPDTRYPRTRRTQFRMNITGLQPDTSWQDLKDFARRSNVDVVFSEVSRDGRGMVEFETHDDLREAVAKLDGTDFKNSRVTCIAEVTVRNVTPCGRGGGGRYRSRSPPPHRRYSPGPPRERGGGYSPPRRRDYSPRRDYRDRSPRREAYSSYERAPRDEPRGRYSPPRLDDMGPARGGRMSPRGGGGGRSPPRYYSGGGGHRDDDHYYSRRR
ncbi:hypothetical protein BGX38DRAFT_1095248 [Terfezia claveryi]|nr:hypothetical protein BGX38DRAFT_1095248 [Terfezia claveryi]